MLFAAIVLSAFLTGHTRGFELYSLRFWSVPDWHSVGFTYAVITACLFIYLALSFSKGNIIAAFLRFAILSFAIYQYWLIYRFKTGFNGEGDPIRSWLLESIPLDITNFILMISIYFIDIFSTVMGNRVSGSRKSY